MKKIKIIALSRNTLLMALCFLLFQCTSTHGPKIVNAKDYNGTIDGKKVALYTLKNQKGMVMQVTNYGAKIVSLFVPDKNGVFTDVVFGFKSLKDCETTKEVYFGSAIGRYGNRIAKGKFSLDGVQYKLAVNDGPNHLHGGLKGLNKVVWDVTQSNDSSVQLSYLSKDMEEGYPGNLKIKITYTLSANNSFKIDYSATTDKKTVCNLTNHSYFNLAGEGNSTITNQIVTINADNFTPIDPTFIPTGIQPVTGTPMDLRQPTVIGERINQDYIQLKNGKGFDHNFVLNDSPKDNNGLTFAASVKDPVSGRVMEVYTTQPGVQFYCGNFLNGTAVGKSGKAYAYRSGLCFETQHFPDSPNHPAFPTTVLEPGQTYHHITVYKFKAE